MGNLGERGREERYFPMLEREGKYNPFYSEKQTPNLRHVMSIGIEKNGTAISFAPGVLKHSKFGRPGLFSTNSFRVDFHVICGIEFSAT